jgi:hypothetical protein
MTKEEVGGGWRRMDNKMLHNFYGSPNIIKVMKSIGGAYSTNGRDKRSI